MRSESGCTLITRKQKRDVADRAQRREEWRASEPALPKGEQPKDPSVAGGIIGFILGVVGLIGGVVFVVVTTGPAAGWAQLGRSFLLVLGFAAAGVAIGAAIFFIEGAVHALRMKTSGWGAYEKAHRRWKLIGDEDFTNHVEPKKEKPKELKRYLNDELGALEYALDHARPGVRTLIKRPSDRRLRADAKRLAKAKRASLAKGERFIEELSYTVQYDVGVNSVGWFSGSGASDEDQEFFRRLAATAFEPQGLQVTKCVLYVRSFSVSARGTETFELVVRVA